MNMLLYICTTKVHKMKKGGNEVIINKLAGYRASAGIKTKEMAELLDIAPQTYLKKEKKQIIFKDTEKIKVLNYLKQFFPAVTLEELFF